MDELRRCFTTTLKTPALRSAGWDIVIGNRYHDADDEPTHE